MFVERSPNGDKLVAEGLDCSLHGSTKIGNNTCFCAGSGTYYTDKNNDTKCFQGRGNDELGKKRLVIASLNVSMKAFAYFFSF